MTPSTIQKREDTFFSTLKPNSGVQYTITGKKQIGSYTIYSIRPPYSSYFYPTATKKSSICLHFTVGYIGSDISALSKENSHVSVPYVVDRCGRIYELFAGTYWSYHLGNGCKGGNSAMSKKSIGIEISNYGPLTLSGNNLVDAYGNTYCAATDTGMYMKHSYRGKDYFATMTDAQMEATAELIRYLCGMHDIPVTFKGDDTVFGSDAEAQNFTGIFCHTNVRADKFDWPWCEQLKNLATTLAEQPKKSESDEQAQSDKTEAAADGQIANSSPENSAKEAQTSMETQESSSETPSKTSQVSEKTVQPAEKSTTKQTASSSLLVQILEMLLGLFASKKK